jgi:tyrosyl-tRNA synthetase
MLRRFQLAGHSPIALVGGATGLIGDPSFKAQERKLNTADIVEQWCGRLRAQISRFLDFDHGTNAARLVNNLDWMSGMDSLSFLRDVGKYFSVNAMIKKESVKQRIEREDSGISYTEFSYMLLQAYDFSQLNRHHDCSLQIGGSDQWGNITEGIDLTRRLYGNQVYGLTVPLITKSDGTKFGKTESGAVWLDPTKTSPYRFFQFWLNTADDDLFRFMRYFTFMETGQIDELQRECQVSGNFRDARQLLARCVTALVHGDNGYLSAQRITEALFGNNYDTLSEQDWAQLKLDGIPHTQLQQTEIDQQSLPGLLVNSGAAANGKQIKDMLGRGAVSVNGLSLKNASLDNANELFVAHQALCNRYHLVKLGKKNYHLFEVKTA